MSETMPMVPAEDVEHVQVCINSRTDVRDWRRSMTRRGEAFRYDRQNWPKNLWGMKADESIDFIEKRYRETTDKREFYSCKLYLSTRIPQDELDMTWEESENYAALQSGHEPSDNQGNRTIAPPENTLEMRPVSIEIGALTIELGGRS